MCPLHAWAMVKEGVGSPPTKGNQEPFIEGENLEKAQRKTLAALYSKSKSAVQYASFVAF